MRGRSVVSWRRVTAVLAAVLTLACCAPAPAPPAAPAPLLAGETLRILIVGDPFASALRSSAEALAQEAGGALDIEVVGYDDVRLLTLRNARDAVSAYDIVSFDVVWAGEYSEAEVLLPLDGLIEATPELAVDDFLPLAYQGSGYDGQQLGLPIQPHPELLWYRRDLLAADGAAPPATTADLLEVARRLNHPERGMYGICWNGQRGQPLGQQMAHFYAAFGQPLLSGDGRPTLDTPRGVAAARFAQELLAVSPPDLLTMAWDQRTRRFSEGACAMTYEWAARSYLAEETPTSDVQGLVGYSAAPRSPGVAPVTPLGTWSLGIPANIGERKELAWRALAWLTGPAVERRLAENGNGGMPRRSLLDSPDLIARYPSFPVVARLSDEGQLADWMRPAVPQWAGLAEILGTVYHDMLRGQLTPEAAAAEAQSQAEALFTRSR